MAGQGHAPGPQLQPAQWVADASLTLDLHIRQGEHDGAALHVGLASSHLPGWDPDPELGTGDRRQEVMCGCGGTDTPSPGLGCGWGWGWGWGAYTPPARPQQLARPTVPRHALSPGFL